MLGIDWKRFHVGQFRMGLDVAGQIEEGKVRSASTTVTVVTVIIVILALTAGGLAFNGTPR